MTVPRWDAQKWHEERSSPRGATSGVPARKPRMKLAATVAAVALCLGAAAVSATTFGDDEKIGICHATGSESNPYVYILADKNGFEHGHHRHHDGDFFVAPGAGCDGDPLDGGAGNETGNETFPEAPANETGNETLPEAPANGTDVPAGNETEAPGNQTGVPGNGTAPGDGAAAGNETGNATPEPAPGDAWVRQTSFQQQDDILLSIQVGNAGQGVASDVELTDSLPDVRRTWYLGGADAGDCTLTGNDLTCWFGQLAPGETRQVELRAYSDRMPCGYSMTNTAQVGSPDDAELRNNASSASILARSC